MWTCNEAAIELAMAVFTKLLHGREFCDETKLLAKEEGIWLDSFLYLT